MELGERGCRVRERRIKEELQQKKEKEKDRKCGGVKDEGEGE